MAAPEGYELLARIGFVDRGNYSASATYLAGDVVYYNGSTWTALKDNLRGVTPAAGENWKYMARGFAAELLQDVQAADTSGLVGTAGAQVDAQALIDAIADKVATKLLLKTDVTSQIINDAAKAASAAALYSVKQELDTTNSNLTSEISDVRKLFDAHSLKNLGNHSVQSNTINALKNWYNSLPSNSVAYALIGDSSGYIFSGGKFMVMAFHSSNAYGSIFIFSYWNLKIKKIIFDNGTMKAPVDA